MSPVDRRPETALAFGSVAVTSRKHIQGPIEPLRQAAWTQDPDARGGQLDRERHPIQTSANVIDRFTLILSRPKVRNASASSLDEQRGRVRARQRPEREDLLGPDPQRRLARDDHLQMRGVRGKLRDDR